MFSGFPVGVGTMEFRFNLIQIMTNASPSFKIVYTTVLHPNIRQLGRALSSPIMNCISLSFRHCKQTRQKLNTSTLTMKQPDCNLLHIVHII